MENGLVRKDEAIEDLLVLGGRTTYDLKCAVHSNYYTCVTVDVTEVGALAAGHPVRLPPDNPERVPGHLK